MSNYFIPYAGRRPAAVVINGHRLIILSKDRASVQSNLPLLGGDRVRVLKSKSKAEEELAFQELASAIKGGVVVAPEAAEFGDVLTSLREQLPWVQ